MTTPDELWQEMLTIDQPVLGGSVEYTLFPLIGEKPKLMETKTSDESYAVSRAGFASLAYPDDWEDTRVEATSEILDMIKDDDRTEGYKWIVYNTMLIAMLSAQSPSKDTREDVARALERIKKFKAHKGNLTVS